MDPKRKRLYIVLLVICVFATAGILLWGRPTPGPVIIPTAGSTTVTPGESKARTINLNPTYPPPSVFPQSQTIDSSVLKSSSFTTLQGFNPATINTTELGRENPFNNY